MQLDAAHQDRLGVVRIDADLTEVHRAGVFVVHLPPGRAGVVRTIEPRRAGTDALRDDAASAERRRLRARRFLGGARRAWCSAPRLCPGFGTRSAAAATAPRALFRRSLNQ
ncbi:MAG: hypothetical protein DMF85_07970 [Acidobacteria bacterium]|nr:MAG: hypothetical protein DMF85_07970 [Acidobacteriota bacterium]